MSDKKVILPKQGQKISINEDHSLNVPNKPIIPFIEGDGIGIDITPPMRAVIDAAVERAYGEKRKIEWLEIYAGEKAIEIYGGNHWLPGETIDLMREYVVSIKGPLTTPIGGGFRSLNVAIRQQMDLYACVRPVRYFPGTATPLRDSSKTNMVIFRENTEDIYAGIEWEAGSEQVKKLINFLRQEMGVNSIRFPEGCGIGVKPVSEQGSKRLIRKAIQYAIDNDQPSVTLVHKGNIMKFTEGAFRNWGYELAKQEFGATLLGEGPWCTLKNPKTGNTITIKDVIADNFLQQILLRPDEYSVIATLNLNGDYISDALAAQVGGIGIAPGANMANAIAVFEATHGTAPKYAGKNQVNPGSIILSGEMMLRYLGWTEAADLVLQGVSGAIKAGQVTYDLARACVEASEDSSILTNEKDLGKLATELSRIVPGGKLLSCSGFGEAVINFMN